MPTAEKLTAQARLLRVLLELHKRPGTALDLGERVGAPWRTVYRDLEALRSAGLKVAVEGVVHKGATYSLSAAEVARWLRTGAPIATRRR